ncbi:MAG: NAD(P)/FAD-dependent oxidoreductase [Acidimicrobiales bacterium]
MRIGVIGVGIVGASIGWHLANHGVEVVMIDARTPGEGVTNWTFSWVNASNKTETKEYFDLNVAGVAAHVDLAATLATGDWWHPSGHLRWFEDSRGAEGLKNQVDLLGSWGYDATVWEAQRARRLLEPEVVFPSDDTPVAVFRDEGWVQGRSLVDRLVHAAENLGAELWTDSTVTGITIRDGQANEIGLADGRTIEADGVVNAAGPAGGQISALVGRDLPMRDEPGIVARLRCDRVPIRRAMHSPHVELRPDGEDLVAIHSREIDGLIDRGTEPHELATRLRELAVEVVPALGTAELVGSSVAMRPIPGDGFPSVGAVTGIDGYYEAITHSGITLGIIIGRLLSEELVEGTVDDLLKPFRPARF